MPEAVPGSEDIATNKRIALLAAAVLLPLAACGRQEAGAGEAREASQSAQTPQVKTRQAQTPPEITIGLSVATATFVLERWTKDARVFSGAAQELGARVLVQLSAGGTQEQIAQINFLLEQNINVLVVIAHDTDMLAGVIARARSAGIPVIAYDRLIMGTPIDAYISFDNQQVGRLLAEALVEAVPRGRYLIVNGSVHDSNSFDINEGLHEVIDRRAAEGGIVVGEEIWLQEWSFDEPLRAVGAIFEASTDFDAISCGNDMIASAVIQLLSERRLAGKVAVVGQDADLLNCQHVVEGVQLMTVYKPIGRLAVRAAALAVAAARGKLPPPDARRDNRSGALIPHYIEKSVAVTRDNMDIVILDGFHSTEDVYRTVDIDDSAPQPPA